MVEVEVSALEGKETIGINCPKCGSKNVHIDKKGYSASSGAAGCCLCGLPGLFCGILGGNKLRGKCLNCGKEFKVDSAIKSKWK